MANKPSNYMICLIQITNNTFIEITNNTGPSHPFFIRFSRQGLPACLSKASQVKNILCTMPLPTGAVCIPHLCTGHFPFSCHLFIIVRSCWGVYWFHSVRPSCIACPLCSAYSSGLIFLIFIHLIKQLQKVCHVKSYLQNLNFRQFFKICDFDFVLFWLEIWCESLVWVYHGAAEGISERRRSSCSSWSRLTTDMVPRGFAADLSRVIGWQKDIVMWIAD